MMLSYILAFMLPLHANDSLLLQNPSQNQHKQDRSAQTELASRWKKMGNRSLEMFDRLDDGALLNYEKNTLSFLHLFQEYEIVTGEMRAFSRIPSVFIGSYPAGREIIALNPNACPLLDMLYQNFTNSLPAGISIVETLDSLKNFINEKVFIQELSNETQLNSFINQWSFDRERSLEEFSPTIDGNYIPVIPIDEFISSGIGVCRHYAYATAYFIDRLSQEGYIDGKGYLVRDLVGSRTAVGGHAWNLFITSNNQEVWHLDTYWQLLENCQDPEGMRSLCYRYGSTAIENQMVRFVK